MKWLWGRSPELSYIGIYQKYFMKPNKCKDEKSTSTILGCPNPDCLETKDIKAYKICKFTYQVYCCICGMKGPVSGDSEEDAITYWNNLLRKN